MDVHDRKSPPAPVSPGRKSAPYWEHFEHDADVGVRGVGKTLEEAFAQAGLALMHVFARADAVEPNKSVPIECQASDDEVLLVDWLNALVYEVATRRMLFGRFDISIDADKLHATAYGETIDPSRHETVVEVKGATYTCLHVGEDSNSHLWTAQCVVDV